MVGRYTAGIGKTACSNGDDEINATDTHQVIGGVRSVVILEGLAKMWLMYEGKSVRYGVKKC